MAEKSYTSEELNAFHDGRHQCRDKYKRYGFLVLNPNIDWQSEIQNPCLSCKEYNNDLKIGCLKAKECERQQRFQTALEVYEHFKDIEKNNKPINQTPNRYKRRSGLNFEKL